MSRMENVEKAASVHPVGEEAAEETGYPAAHRVDTPGGTVYVQWEDDAEVTAHGTSTYFLEFLKTSGLWTEFVDDCPLKYTSPNAPAKSEILGTILLSVLSGHRRYAHITAMRPLTSRAQIPSHTQREATCGLQQECWQCPA